MIGLDTNVLVRYTVRDDPAQTALADELIDALTPERVGYLTLTVLIEVWWVLQRSYSYPAERCCPFIEALLEAREFTIEDPDLVRGALRLAREGADFADAMIAQSCLAAGCAEVKTFDRSAAQRAGMTLLT